MKKWGVFLLAFVVAVGMSACTQQPAMSTDESAVSAVRTTALVGGRETLVSAGSDPAIADEERESSSATTASTAQTEAKPLPTTIPAKTLPTEVSTTSASTRPIPTDPLPEPAEEPTPEELYNIYIYALYNTLTQANLYSCSDETILIFKDKETGRYDYGISLREEISCHDSRWMASSRFVRSKNIAGEPYEEPYIEELFYDGAKLHFLDTNQQYTCEPMEQERFLDIFMNSDIEAVPAYLFQLEDVELSHYWKAGGGVLGLQFEMKLEALNREAYQQNILNVSEKKYEIDKVYLYKWDVYIETNSLLITRLETWMDTRGIFDGHAMDVTVQSMESFDVASGALLMPYWIPMD